MWQDKVLMWEDTSSHIWNSFGDETTPLNSDEELYVKGILIWRKTTLREFVEKAITLFDTTQKYLEDKNILSSVMLVITIISLFPFSVKIVKDDDVANKFLSLINRDKEHQYILKYDFEKSDFAKIESLNLLILDLIKNDILIDTHDKYIINGKVLNEAHLIE